MTIPKNTRSFWYRNGLSLVLLALLLACWSAQAITGWHVKNAELLEEGVAQLTLPAYLHSHHFWAATGENWESEFLQMGLYVLLTIGLRQKGSSESKKLEGKEDVDREPQPSAEVPWPVRKGGLYKTVYSHSLSIAFILLFLFSFLIHFTHSWADHNEELIGKGEALLTRGDYLGSAHFWFESFQNWQSEFLAVLSIVVLSIHLRQKGSPESKPVDAPHSETGH